MPHRLLQTALATLVIGGVVSAIAWASQSESNFQIESTANAATVARLKDTAERSLRLFGQWLGPLNGPTLKIVDLPWDAAESPGASYPGTVMTRGRWLAPERDLIAERALIAAIARQFWMPATGQDPWFREGLVIYTATRGIHNVLEGRNYAAPRSFGGFVPFPLRGLLLSPSPAGARPTLRVFDEVVEPAQAPWRFASVEQGGAASRSSIALQTLERVIGWPAMQQALQQLRARASTEPLTPELLASVIAEQQGSSMHWFVRDLVRSSDRIDYAAGTLESVAAGGRFRTNVTVQRLGGEFAATDLPRSAGTAHSIEVAVTFEDGSEARGVVDGRDAVTDLVFDSVVPAIAVRVDPDQIVLADVDRWNNARLARPAPADPVGVRMVLNWLMWLQNVMLTSTVLA